MGVVVGINLLIPDRAKINLDFTPLPVLQYNATKILGGNKMKSTKKVFCIALALVLALSCAVLAGCGGSSSAVKGITPATSTSKTAASSNASQAVTQAAEKTPYSYTPSDKDNEPYKAIELKGYKKPYTGTSKRVAIDVKDYGTISLILDPTYAPISVQNFLNLVNEGFYDGLTFHRIIKGFMIQGGDPQGNGSGGSDNDIKGEFSANGVENPVSHKRGVLSMARANSYDSGSSQFFIVHEDSPFLDGNYAAFGYVTDGMDVVDQIAENTPVVDGNGTVLAANQPVINSIKIIE